MLSQSRIIGYEDAEVKVCPYLECFECPYRDCSCEEIEGYEKAVWVMEVVGSYANVHMVAVEVGISESTLLRWLHEAKDRGMVN